MVLVDILSNALFGLFLITLWGGLRVDITWFWGSLISFTVIIVLAYVSRLLKYGEHHGWFLHFDVRRLLKKYYLGWEPGELYKHRKTVLGGIVRFAIDFF